MQLSEQRQLEAAQLLRRFSTVGRLRADFRRRRRQMSWLLLVQLLGSAKRTADFLAALMLIVILSPLLLVLCVWYFVSGRRLTRNRRLGRWAEPFEKFELDLPRSSVGKVLRKMGLNRLPVLINILKGDMSFVGPRAVAEDEISPRHREARSRYDVRPGLICLWWIRRHANIDYGFETQADDEYVQAQSLGGDIGIGIRAIPALLSGRSATVTSDTVEILGISVNNLTMSKAVEQIILLASGPGHNQVCFVNADCANIACLDADYRKLLADSALVLADGIGMKLAGKLLGSEIRQNVNGTDLLPRLCAALEGTGKGIFLLGGHPGVAKDVAQWIRDTYPGVTVSGYRQGYFAPDKQAQVIQQIAESGASLLLVAMGAPRQDNWIHQHLDRTNVGVAMGVGGLFDFYSKRIPRAPQWLREMGLEWFYRFIQEPRRMWQRYFVGNVNFLGRVICQRRRIMHPDRIKPAGDKLS